MSDFEFDLNEVEETPADEAPDGTPISELEQWADAQLSDKANSHEPAYFDIETGPRPDEELKAVYREKTEQEFADTCDKRWKADTVAAKYAEYKVNAWQEFVNKAALSPTTGRVLLTGILRHGDLHFLDADSEADNLRTFWADIEVLLIDKVPIIGHNSNGFDLLFMVRRSWLLGVMVPREVRQGRYWNPLFRDTMEWWNCGARDYVKLNAIAGFFGVGQKTEGFKGGDFSELWFGQMPVEQWGTPAEQRAKALEYNGQDLRLTALIAARMGMVS